MELIRSFLLHRRRPSPHYSWVGSCITFFEACSAFTRVTTYRLTESPFATLYTGGSGGFVASTAAPIVTGWSDPVPGRAFLPAVDQRLFTAHCNCLVTSTTRSRDLHYHAARSAVLWYALLSHREVTVVTDLYGSSLIKNGAHGEQIHI